MGKGAEGKGARKPKKIPEDFGFQLVKGGLHVRVSQLRYGFPVEAGSGENSCMEIGNLEKIHAPLPQGNAKLEVLCNRQTVLGNPFSMLRGSGPQASNRSEDFLAGPPNAQRQQEPEDPQMRDAVCELFEDFLPIALDPETSGCLQDVAEASVQRLGHPREIIGKDWARDFGCRSCEDFRANYMALQGLMAEHRGSIRLLCHCVPLRCHTRSLAARLCSSSSLPEEMSCAPLLQGSESISTEVPTKPARRWGKSATGQISEVPCSHDDNKPMDSCVGEQPHSYFNSSAERVPATTPSVTNVQKEVLRLQKTLREIEALEQRQLSGEKLEGNQLSKIARKTNLLESLEELSHQ